MKISSDASVIYLTHEGIISFATLFDFDKKNIQCLPNICKKSIPIIDIDASNNVGSESTVSRSNMHSVSVIMLVTAFNTSKYCVSFARVMNLNNIKYFTVLATFKVEYNPCLSVNDEAKPKAPKTNDRDNIRNDIHCSQMFKYFLPSSCESCVSLSCVIHEGPVVPDDAMDPLITNCYCGES